MRQKMKKRWLVIVALAMMALVGGTLFWVASPVQAAHTHSYRWVIKKNATCTSEGYKNLECSCGACSGSQTIPKTPHNFNVNAATCTTAKKCRTCGYVAQAATGHSWNRGSATCTASKSCTKCGTVSQNALGHCYVQVTTKQPTCGAGGTYETKCSRCGIGSPTGNGSIPATGQHTWDRAEATCTAAKKCTTCGAIGQAAKGHNFYWVEVVSPTCAQVGRRDLRCATCGYVSDSQTLDKVPSHNLTITRVEPTYDADGYEKKHCTICSYVEYNTVLSKPKRSCGVILDPQNGSASMSVSAFQGEKYGDILPTVSKTGYNFQGWYTAKSGGTKITADSIVPSSTVVQLYAQWKVKTYTVKFNANGGTGGPTSMKKTYGTASVVPSEVPTKEGYEFIGWADSLADANAKKISCSPNSYFTRNKNMTLYAVWNRYEFFAHNGRFKKTYSIQVPYNSAVESAKAVKPEQYMAIYNERSYKYNTEGLSDEFYLYGIEERAGYLLALGSFGNVSPIPEATGMLGHYFDATGTRYTYDARRFVVGGSGVAPDRFNSEINSVMREMEKTLLPGESITFTDKNAAINHITFMATKNGFINDLLEFNNFFSVKEGSIGISATGFRTEDGIYHLDYYYFVQDYYDFYYETGDINSQANNNVLGVYVDELAYLEAFGRAKSFETCGIYHVIVNWYPGQVVDIQQQYCTLSKDGKLAQVYNVGYSEEELFK